MEFTYACYVVLVAAVVVIVIATFGIQIVFVILALRVKCRNTCAIVTVSAVGLTIQSSLCIALYKGITGCGYRLFLFNYMYKHTGTAHTLEYVNCCGDFRVLSIVLSVINFVVLIHQTIGNNLPDDRQRTMRYVTFAYFSVITTVMGWIYWTPAPDLTFTTVEGSLGNASLPTCPQAARAHILAVLMETLFIYGPGLYVLRIPLNCQRGQPESQLQYSVMKNCWTDDGAHCSVCNGSNGLLRDVFVFYAITMLILRPASYLYCSTYNGQISEIFVFGCNLLIPIVLGVNAIPYLNRIFVKPAHAVDDGVITKLNTIEM